LTAGIKANADGSAAIQVGGSDAITITSGLNTTFAGTAAVPTGTLYPIVSGTAVASTSGTSIDFTGIPSWVKRITVMLQDVSTNGSSNLLIQLGDSGGVETTGYLGAGNNSAVGVSNFTTGFGSNLANTSGSILQGIVTIQNINGNSWIASGALSRSDAAALGTTAGSKSLSATLDRVRITTVNGTDTFDAGSINILYE
jgi:hypothetical protein